MNLRAKNMGSANRMDHPSGLRRGWIESSHNVDVAKMQRAVGDAEERNGDEDERNKVNCHSNLN